MKENTREKNVVKYQKGIFSRIRTFFKEIFFKEIEEEVKTSYKVENKVNSHSKFYTQMRKEVEQRKEVLDLQYEFEHGMVSEEDLSENQKNDLEKLYDEQIKELENNIANKQKELEKKMNMVNEYYKKMINLKA